MKHVWILNHYAQEPGGAGGTRHYALAKHLKAYGWKATIFAASVDHVTGVERLAAGQDVGLETCDGVPFVWLRTRAYRGNGADRVGNMLDYTRAVLRNANHPGVERPNIVIGSSVHPLAAWAGRRLAKRFGVPFIFEVRDLWPQTLIDMGRLRPHHPITLGLRWLEKSLYRSADRIIVLLPKAVDYINAQGIDTDKVVWIPNGADLDALESPMAPYGHDDGGFTLMYFGAHGAANDLETLLGAMDIVRRQSPTAPIRLRMIGNGPGKPALEAMARELHLKNVQFEPPVPKRDIPSLAQQADAFVICVKDLPGLYRFGISMNKIYDYLAAARPVLIAVDAGNNPIEEAGAGLTVPPGDSAALADAILRMAEMPKDKRLHMGHVGRLYLEKHHDMAELARRLASTLDETLAS